MGITRWESLSYTLEEMRKQGVKFRLSSDTVEMQFSAAQGVLSEWEREFLNLYRKEFTEALRHEAGLCILCGMEAAKHPNMTNGRRRDAKSGKWIPMENPAHLIKPVLFCTSCWNAGGLEQWSGLTEGRGGNASSTNQRAGSGAKEIAFPGDDGEAAPSPDAAADLFNGY